jgi:hypothetical protein
MQRHRHRRKSHRRKGHRRNRHRRNRHRRRHRLTKNRDKYRLRYRNSLLKGDQTKMVRLSNSKQQTGKDATVAPATRDGNGLLLAIYDAVQQQLTIKDRKTGGSGVRHIKVAYLGRHGSTQRIIVNIQILQTHQQPQLRRDGSS